MNIEFIKLHKFIEDNEELMSYINRLLKVIDYKNKENNNESLNKLQKLGNSYLEETEATEELMEKMNSLGLNLSSESVIYLDGYIPEYVEDSKKAIQKYGHYSFRHNDEYCCYHDYEWENEDRVSYPITINGFKVTKKILEDEEKNHTSKKNYEKWLKENPEINTELKELEIIISQDLELLDKKIFGKKQLKERILANKEKLINLQNRKQQGDYLKKRSDFFASLKGEKKELVIEYLNSIDKCNNISIDIKKEVCGLHISCKDEMISNVDQLIEMAINYEFVSEQEVEKYNYILMNIDLSNVMVSDSYIDNIKTGRYYWYGDDATKQLIGKYCHKIVDMKLEEDVKHLTKEAEEKAKTKKK